MTVYSETMGRAAAFSRTLAWGMAGLAIALCVVMARPAGAQAGDPQDRAAELQSQRERIQALMEARRQEIERRREVRETMDEDGEGGEPEEDFIAVPVAPTPVPTDDGDIPPPMAITASTYLIITPSRSNVQPGEVFDTHVQVLNTNYVPLDDVEIHLKYPQDVLRLVAVSDAAMRPRLDGQPVYDQSATSGVLYYHGMLDPPHHFHRETLMTLRWEALLPALSVPLRFLQSADSDERTTALRLRGKNRLGQESNPLDGTLMGEVSVYVPETHVGRPVVDRPAATLGGGMRLRMSTETDGVVVGDVTTMTVHLENPGGLMMDTVRLRMWFDPQALEVVNWDHRNWIKLGTNVQDGFAREVFPFSFHGVNAADNHYGQIDYQMALSGRFIPPDAPLIKILFRAKAPAQENLVCFDITPDRRRTAPQTALFYEGRNVLDYGAMLVDYSIFHNVPVVESPAPGRRGE